MTKEEDVVIDNEDLESEIKSVLNDTEEGKILLYRFCKKWSEFLESLDKEDRLILLKMIMDVSNYNEGISSIINRENSESYSDLMFFLLTMMLQQKKLDRSNTSGRERDVTLLDFISNSEHRK